MVKSESDTEIGGDSVRRVGAGFARRKAECDVALGETSYNQTRRQR